MRLAWASVLSPDADTIPMDALFDQLFRSKSVD